MHQSTCISLPSLVYTVIRGFDVLPGCGMLGLQVQCLHGSIGAVVGLQAQMLPAPAVLTTKHTSETATLTGKQTSMLGVLPIDVIIPGQVCGCVSVGTSPQQSLLRCMPCVALVKSGGGHTREHTAAVVQLCVCLMSLRVCLVWGCGVYSGVWQVVCSILCWCACSAVTDMF